MKYERVTQVVLLALALWRFGGESPVCAAAGPAPVDYDRAAGFSNPGVYHMVVEGRLFEWIPTEDVTFDIRPNGKVRIVAPLTKRSFDGQVECRRFIYDHLHRRLGRTEEGALFGDGLMLPPGSYGFVIQWVNARDYDEVQARPWDLTCNPETFQGNSAQLDYFYLSIVTLQPGKPEISEKAVPAIREVTLPAICSEFRGCRTIRSCPTIFTCRRTRGSASHVCCGMYP